MLIGLGLACVGYSAVLGAVGRAAPPEKRSRALALTSLGGSTGQFIFVPTTHVLIETQGWVLAMLGIAAAATLMVPLARGVAGQTAATAPLATQRLRQSLRAASGPTRVRPLTPGRPEERRVGSEGVRSCRTRWTQ